MKKILIMVIMTAACHFTFAQQIENNDPSVSIHNYKHANKAAFAKKHNTDESIVIHASKTKKHNNYKQNFGASTDAQGCVVKTKPKKTNVSYKHPYGL